MRLIQGSGVIVVLPQAWIEELYYQVLEFNLLGEAGYWGSPEDQTMPLITMLTGNGITARLEPRACPVRTVLLSPVRYQWPGQQWDWSSADQQGAQSITSQLCQEQQ